MTRSGAEGRWLFRAPTRQMIAVSVLCGIGVWVLLVAADLIGVLESASLGVALAMATVDAVVGIVVGLLFLRILLTVQARNRQIVRNLQIIEEMNHHIRNALERIQLAIHLTQDKDIVEHMNESSSRIEWTLRELLPKSGSHEG